MKKFLVVLLILAVAGGGLFAQELKFTGGVYGGLAVTVTDQEDSWATFTNAGIRNNMSNVRFDLSAAATNADGTAGFNAGTRFTYDPFGNGDTSGYYPKGSNPIGTGAGHNITVTRAEAWIKMLDGMVEVHGGLMDSGGAFGTGGGIDTSFDIGGGTGMYVNVAPIDGLQIRASVRPNATSLAAAGIAPAGTTPTPAEQELINDYKRLSLGNTRYTFGVTYTVPEIVTVVALLRQGQSDLAANLGAATGNALNYKAPWALTDAALGIKVLALKDMGFTTLNLDFGFYNLQASDYAKNRQIAIGEQVAFAVSPEFTVGGRFQQQIALLDSDWEKANKNTVKMDLTFAAYGSYTMGDIIPRLDVGFNVGSRGTGTGRTGAYWDAVGKGSFRKDAMQLNISPSVRFRFGGSNNYLDLGYNVGVDLSKYSDENPASTTAKDPASTIRHTFGVDYRVTF